MIGVYSFRAGPTYRGATPQEQFEAAMSQPLSLGRTLLEEFKGGALESFGLGTAIKDFTVPEGEPTTGEQVGNAIRLANPITAPYEVARRTAQAFMDQGEALDEEAYKASPYYREGIPWDAGMTDERAAALAMMDDAKKVREFYASKRPISSFIGNLAGQAVDPINYIPVAGPAVKAAAVARLGKIGGAALHSAVDAAANTALFGIGTRERRGRYGDDVSWQATVSQIATAALIGAAFGTLGGAWEARKATKGRAIEERLATLKTTQEARIALNEAIDGLSRGEDISLSPTAVEAVAASVARLSPEPEFDRWGYGDYQARDLADATPPSIVFHGTSRGGFDRFDPYGSEYGLMGSGSYFTEDPRIAAEYTAKGKGSEPTVYEARIEARQPMNMDAPANVQAWKKAFPDYLDDKPYDGFTNERMYREVEDALTQEQIPVYEGAEVMQYGIRDMGFDSVTHVGGGRHKDSKGQKHRVWVVFDPEQISVTGRRTPQTPPRVDTRAAPASDAPAERSAAEARIAKPENAKALADQYGVDPQSGSFAEEAEVAQVAAEGRLSEQDAAVLTDAQAAYDDGAAYGEALKAAVACLI